MNENEADTIARLTVLKKGNGSYYKDYQTIKASTEIGFASPISYIGRTAIELLKQGWNEIPDVVGSGALGLAAVIATWVAYAYKEKKGLIDHRRYRMEYTVVRSDDPLAQQSPQYFKYDAAFSKKN